MELLEFQRHFAARLQDLPNQMDQLLEVPHGWSQEQASARLSIYRNNFVISLLDALKLVYPITLQMLGDDAFRQQGRRFILQHPPEQSDVSWYGEGFAEHLDPLAKQFSLPYLVSLADLEWQFYLVGQGPWLERQLQPQQLASLSETQQAALRLFLQPGLCLCHYPMDVLSLHQCVRAGDTDELGKLQLDQPVWLALYRQDPHQVKAQPLTGEQYSLLLALQATPSLSQLLSEQDPDLLAPLGQLLQLPLFSHFDTQG